MKPFQCEVCNVTCDTKDVLEKHKVGKKHVKNMKKLSISSPNAPKMAPPQAPVVGSENSVGELENKKDNLLFDTLYCQICNVVCNINDYKSHVAGRRHSAKVAKANCSSQAQPSNKGASKKRVNLLFWCELCKISCTSNALLNLHLSGKKHLKNLKRSEPDLSLTMEYKEKVENPIEPNRTVTTEPNRKRVGSHEDVQTKKRKVVQGGGVSDAASKTCTMCNVICNSVSSYHAHLVGRKHVMTVVRQAEAQL
ncbi:uncharacterized protein [Rutidosis leptorrhynchoides]|uniref:uncharacterized protein n=1 Tax=Rutidosis leptorrhynchoides TaxID=125765 RepID=UPI003A9A57EB